MKRTYFLCKFLEENKVFEGKFRACRGYIDVGHNVKIGEEYAGYKEGYICSEEIIWKKDGTLELRRRKLRKRTLEIVEEIRPLWGLRIDDIYLKDVDEDIHIKVNRFQYKTFWKSKFIIAEAEDNKYIITDYPYLDKIKNKSIIVDNPYLDSIKKVKYIEIDIKKGTYPVVKVYNKEYMSEYLGVIGKIILHEYHGYIPAYEDYLATLFVHYVGYLFSLKEKSDKDITGL